MDELEENGYVRIAAQVAYTFHLDPVDILKSNYFDWATRVAAKRYVLAELEKQRQKQQSTKK